MGAGDTGAAGVSAIVVTFVFSVYLTGTVGKGLTVVFRRRVGWVACWRSPV